MMVPDVLRQLALLFAFRALPFAAHWLLARRRSRGVLLYLGLFGINAWLSNLPQLLQCSLGYAYYVAVGCLVPALTGLLRRARISRGALFAMLTTAYLLLPGLVVPGAVLRLFLVIGWDLLLSSYSYCCEVAREPADPRLHDCLFFLFVDPTLSYANRSRPVAASQDDLRIALGAVCMLVSGLVLDPAIAAGAWLGSAAVGALRLVDTYLAHAGLAHLQIGMLRETGYVAPERYRQPFLARNPFDFWRRWNTYVGDWLRRYVFVPTVVRLGTSHQARSTRVLALLVTLSASGLLHDGFVYASSRVWSTRALEFFLLNGVAMFVWAVAARLRRRLALGANGRFVRLASHGCLLAALLGASAVWG